MMVCLIGYPDQAKKKSFASFVYLACPVGKDYRTGVKFIVMRSEADFTGVVQIFPFL